MLTNNLESLLKTLIKTIPMLFIACTLAASGGIMHSIPHIFTKDKLQGAVTLYYYSDFFYNKNDALPDNPECRRYFKKNRYIVKCREYMELIAPYRIINRWKLEEKEKGYILFSTNSSGVYGIHAYIQSINTLTFSINKTLNNTDYRPVIGIFKRHAPNVKRYTFKNLTTGIKSQINATPDHPFYVMNKRKFISIDRISPTDTLITDTGRKLHLLCHEKHNCGMPLSKKRLNIVYNLEIYKSHIYSVGDEHITVHNCYIILHDMVLDAWDKKHLPKAHLVARSRLNIQSARRILEQVKLSEHVNDTAFFLLPVTERGFAKFLYIGEEKLTMYSLGKIILKGRNCRYICLIHDPPPNRLSFFSGVVKQLANRLGKSIIYTTKNEVEMSIPTYSQAVYELLAGGQNVLQHLSTEQSNYLQMLGAQMSATLRSLNQFAVLHPRF